MVQTVEGLYGADCSVAKYNEVSRIQLSKHRVVSRQQCGQHSIVSQIKCSGQSKV